MLSKYKMKKSSSSSSSSSSSFRDYKDTADTITGTTTTTAANTTMDDINNIIIIKDKEIQTISLQYETDIESLCLLIIEREKLITEMESTILDIDDKYKVLENELKNEKNDNRRLRMKLKEISLKLQNFEDVIDDQQNQIIELKHNVNNNSSSTSNTNSSRSPIDKSKKKKNNSSPNDDDDLLDAAKIALSVSPSTSPRDHPSSSSSSLPSKSLKSNSNDIDSDSTKLIKNPLTLKPAPRLVKESGTYYCDRYYYYHHDCYHHSLLGNESRLEQLLKHNSDSSKWSEYKKHDRLFEQRNLLNKKGRSSYSSNDSNDDYNTSNNIQIYDDIEEKDIEKYKPPLPPNNKHKNDLDNNAETKSSTRVKSIFRTASDVIKNGLSTRRSWDSRSPSPAGDNSDTRSNNSDKSNASILSKSSTNSTTRGRLLGVKKKSDITIYPTDNDEDLDVSYI